MNVNPKRLATCHPTLLNHAKGLCQRCYWAQHHATRKASPEYVAKREAAAKRYPQSRRRRNHQRWSDKAKYGLTPQDVVALLDRQNHRCALCYKAFEGRRFCVDHDHRTGEVRGLLHGKCNSLLGMAGDDERVLLRAVRYLNVGKVAPLWEGAVPA